MLLCMYPCEGMYTSVSLYVCEGISRVQMKDELAGVRDMFSVAASLSSGNRPGVLPGTCVSGAWQKGNASYGSFWPQLS